ncbi:MAG: hybrid sensor histidine kinase/response regulator [Kiritimatiellae bacterium]|nr:hybrid sensor histidine kinase/response regulator [Kiritimatiellia bacterium]
MPVCWMRIGCAGRCRNIWNGAGGLEEEDPNAENKELSEQDYLQIDAAMLGLFRAELDQHGKALRAGLASDVVSGDTASLEPIIRAVHSIRGAARIVGVLPVAELAGVMETLLTGASEGRGLSPAHLAEIQDASHRLVELADTPAEELPAALAQCDEVFQALTGRLKKPPVDESGDVSATPPAASDLQQKGASTSGGDRPAEAQKEPAVNLEELSLPDIFRMDLQEHARMLDQGLVAVESDASAAQLENLMRAAHSIKGSARIIGIDVMGSLAHVMEDIFLAVQRGGTVLTSDVVDVLLQANDLFMSAAERPGDQLAASVEAEAEQYRAMVARLTAIRDGQGVEQPAEAGASPVKRAVPETPAPAEVPPTPARADHSDARVVRVQAGSLSRLMGLAGEFLVETRSMRRFSDAMQEIKTIQRELNTELERNMDQIRQTSAEVRFSEATQRHLEDVQQCTLDYIERYEQFSRRLEQLSDRLYNEVITSRMRPFSDGLHGFPRMVRDVARQLGKEVDYLTEGGNTPVDRDILDRLEAPLSHLIRNAVDHGLEKPEERVRLGKKAQGRILLNAEHRAGMLYITVRDDGCGVDRERLKKKALERRHVTPEMAEQLSDSEWLQFLFLPGFSTAEKVSDISGRGVGLDVVHAMVREVGGGVTVQSEVGKGTAFVLELPLTLSVLRTLVIRVSGQQFALPLSRIDRLLMVEESEIETLEDRRFFTLENEHLGLVQASQVLGLPIQSAEGAQHPVMVISDALSRYAVEVGEFIGQRDLVVLPLDARLGKVPNVSAGAIREDGSPLLILDIDDLVRSIEHLLTYGKPAAGERGGGRRPQRSKHVLVVDDSITVREVERKLLTGKGYEVTVAVDGVEGWNVLQNGGFDLVVSDVDMPRMNGIELVERIKSSPQYAAIPVMIVSYKDREEDRLRGLRAGANYYLTKSSFHDETLVQAVEDLIGESQEGS